MVEHRSWRRLLLGEVVPPGEELDVTDVSGVYGDRQNRRYQALVIGGRPPAELH
jgi:hypothetical protein